jgi:hypothetical protein
MERGGPFKANFTILESNAQVLLEGSRIPIPHERTSSKKQVAPSMRLFAHSEVGSAVFEAGTICGELTVRALTVTPAFCIL